MKQIRILNMVADSGNGGAQKVALQLHQLVNESGYTGEITFLDTVDDSKLGPLSLSNSFRKVIAAVKLYFWVLRIKSSGKFDVVVSHIDRADWLNACTNFHFTGKSIIYCHGSKTADTNYGGFLGSIRRQMTYQAYGKADYIICVSHGLQNELTKHGVVQNNKVTTIYNWMNSNALVKMASEELDTEFAALAKTGRKIFVVSSRLSSQKDIGTLLLAYSEANFTDPPLLLIVGDGEEYSKLVDLAQRSNTSVCKVGEIPDPSVHDVVFTGYQENPHKFVALADTVLSSSIWEGLPLSILEALLLKKRVVANDCPHGPKELISLANEISYSPSNVSTERSFLIPMKGNISDLSAWIKALEHCSCTCAEEPTSIELFQEKFSADTATRRIHSLFATLTKEQR